MKKKTAHEGTFEDWVKAVGPRHAIGRLIMQGWSASLAEKAVTGRYENGHRPKFKDAMKIAMACDGFTLSDEKPSKARAS